MLVIGRKEGESLWIGDVRVQVVQDGKLAWAGDRNVNAKCTLCHELFSETTLARAMKLFETHVIEAHGKHRNGLRLQRLPRKQCKPAN